MYNNTQDNQDLRTALEGAYIVCESRGEPIRYSVRLGYDTLTGAQGAHKAVIAYLTAPPRPDHAGGVERVRHLKRGTEYEVLGEAEAQVSTGYTDGWGTSATIRDGNSLTVYRDPTSGKLWCRFTDEFRDGRFETITPDQAPDKAAEREGVEAACEAAWNAYRYGTPENRGPGWNDASPRSAWHAAWSACVAALAPKPTGTEAGRGVDAVPQHLKVIEETGASVAAAVTRRLTPIIEEEVSRYWPDSTGQGDGTSQEGGQ